MTKFMLHCGFNFEAYAKNVREKTTKCSLDSIAFTRLIQIGTVAPNYFHYLLLTNNFKI